MQQTGKPSLEEWSTPGPTFKWNDDGIFLICERPEYLVDGYWAWDMDVTGMTPEQAAKVLDSHLKEKHV